MACHSIHCRGDVWSELLILEGKIIIPQDKLREDLCRYRGCVPGMSFVCEGVGHLFLEAMRIN